jgi:hypothetical protein
MADISVNSLTRVGVGIDVARQLVASSGARAPIYVDEYTNPIATSGTSLRAATASVITERTTTSFLAGGVAALADTPRQIVFVTAGVTPADAPASALITGTDVNGDAQTETVNLAQTATSATSTKFFSTVTSIVEAAGDGTAATISIGVGAALGLRRKAKVRAGAVLVACEISAGTRLTTGTFTVPASAPPNGSYTPAAAADASRDYAVAYEVDLT